MSKTTFKKIIFWINSLIFICVLTVLFLISFTAYILYFSNNNSEENIQRAETLRDKSVDTNEISADLGKRLISNTSTFYGDGGLISNQTNGMNCQNCHLDAGTRPYGNNFFKTASEYPKYRARSGTKETLVQRINDCFERSLNGKPLDSTSVEMLSIIAYLSAIPDGYTQSEQKGIGLPILGLLDRAADTLKGEIVYKEKCQICHGTNGQGIKNEKMSGYLNPPLWGETSYNSAAGLYRLGSFASFVKYNMPIGATFDQPILTDEEAWDVAAYINSRPRPNKVFEKDWPIKSQKPFDYPFGPYADSFSEYQHKFGPFGPILGK